jgi:nitroreductase
MTGETFLAFLRARRSVREFDRRPVAREALARLVEAATTAPSATNRQPWRFTVVTRPALLAEVLAAVRARVDALRGAVARGHHGDDLGDYWDYLWRALETAPALVVPQYRVHPDVLAELLASAGPEAAALAPSADLHVEVCGTSAAVMALLLQAEAERLGACWMSGPVLAEDLLAPLLGIRAPWKMLGIVAVGRPAAPQADATRRRPLAQVVDWLVDGPEDETR